MAIGVDLDADLVAPMTPAATALPSSSSSMAEASSPASLSAVARDHLSALAVQKGGGMYTVIDVHSVYSIICTAVLAPVQGIASELSLAVYASTEGGLAATWGQLCLEDMRVSRLEVRL